MQPAPEPAALEAPLSVGAHGIGPDAAGSDSPVAFAPAPAPAALPEGWERSTGPDGRVYYIDHNTQSTHWDPPPAPAPAPRTAAPIRPRTPPEPVVGVLADVGGVLADDGVRDDAQLDQLWRQGDEALASVLTQKLEEKRASLRMMAVDLQLGEAELRPLREEVASLEAQLQQAGGGAPLQPAQAGGLGAVPAAPAPMPIGAQAFEQPPLAQSAPAPALAQSDVPPDRARRRLANQLSTYIMVREMGEDPASLEAEIQEMAVAQGVAVPSLSGCTMDQVRELVAQLNGEAPAPAPAAAGGGGAATVTGVLLGPGGGVGGGAGDPVHPRADGLPRPDAALDAGFGAAMGAGMGAGIVGAAGGDGSSVLARQMSAEEYLRKQEADRRLAEELSQQWMAEDELGAAEREMDRLRREVAESAGAFLWEFEGEEGCKLAMPSRFDRAYIHDLSFQEHRCRRGGLRSAAAAAADGELHGAPSDGGAGGARHDNQPDRDEASGRWHAPGVQRQG